MGHYDTCRPGNCRACGQALGFCDCSSPKKSAEKEMDALLEPFGLKFVELASARFVELYAKEGPRYVHRLTIESKDLNRLARVIKLAQEDALMRGGLFRKDP